MNRISRRSVIASGLAALMPFPVRATDWPTRSISLVHGFPPGGTVDLIARVIGDRLSKRLGQPIVVESKPGASGTTAATLVSRAAPDGYTLFAIPSGHIIVGATFKSLAYRTVDDFSAIGTTTQFPYLLVIPAGSPAKTVKELVDFGRSKDAPLLYGTPGNGSGPHLAIERLARQLDIRVQHVPYRGSSAAVVDLVGGRIDFMMDPPGPLLQFVKEGKLRALAVTGGERFFSLPDVPTLQESGVSGYVVTSWQALLAPPGLPEAIQSRLNTELNAVLQEREVIERFQSLGTIPRPSTPAQLKSQMEKELAEWVAVVKATNFEPI